MPTDTLATRYNDGMPVISPPIVGFGQAALLLGLSLFYLVFAGRL